MATDRIIKQVIKYISDMEKKAKQMSYVKHLKKEVEIGANGTQKYMAKALSHTLWLDTMFLDIRSYKHEEGHH